MEERDGEVEVDALVAGLPSVGDAYVLGVASCLTLLMCVPNSTVRVVPAPPTTSLPQWYLRKRRGDRREGKSNGNIAPEAARRRGPHRGHSILQQLIGECS